MRLSRILDPEKRARYPVTDDEREQFQLGRHRGMTHPFSYQELFEGLRRFVPDDEARQLASEAAAPLVPRTGDVQSGRSMQPHQTIDFSRDLLIVMSFVSDETRAKVEQWRRHTGEPSPEEQAAWNKRRTELTEWASDGYGRQEGADR